MNAPINPIIKSQISPKTSALNNLARQPARDDSHDYDDQEALIRQIHARIPHECHRNYSAVARYLL
jgi:hypothetical protein